MERSIHARITLKCDKFPKVFKLPRPLLVSVSSIKYVDSGGTEQTLADSVYDVDVYSEPGRVGLAFNQSWPAIRGDINGVEVIYIAGYGAASAVPEGVKAAMKLLIGHLYEHRESVSEINMAEVPMAVKSLLSMDRIF